MPQVKSAAKDNPYSIRAQERTIHGAKLNETVDQESSLFNVRSFNKGYNRGKFSQLRYLLGNQADRVQTSDQVYSVARNQQEFKDTNFKQRTFGSTAYQPTQLQSALQNTSPNHEDRE